MEPSKAEVPSNLTRVLVTAAVVALYLLGQVLPLPGFSWADLPDEGAWLTRLVRFSSLSVGALGAVPIVSGYLVVEFAAALVPPWRSLRNGSVRGRQSLNRAALVASLVLALSQSWLMATQLTEFGSPFAPSQVVAAHLSWTVALLALSFWAERSGALGGMQSLVLAEAVSLGVQGMAGDGEWIAAVLFQLGVICCSIPALTGPGWESRGTAEKPRAQRLLVPWVLAGMLPLSWALSALRLPGLVGQFPGVMPAVQTVTGWLMAHPWWTFLVLALAAFALSPVFYRRKVLRALDGTLGLASEPEQAETARFARARLLNLGYLTFVWALALIAWHAGVPIQFHVPLVVVALLLDAQANLRFRAEHPDATVVYRCDRVYWGVRVATALRANGVGCHLSGLRTRSLFHFFGPHLPIGVVVPGRNAARAEEILGQLKRNGGPMSEERRSAAVEVPLHHSDRPHEEKRRLAAWLPSLWLTVGAAFVAAAAMLVPPEPLWEGVRAGDFAVYEVDDKSSPFQADVIVNCPGVELRSTWAGLRVGRVNVLSSADVARLDRCLESVPLPPGRRALKERVFHRLSEDPADEKRQTLVGWQTVLVHETPLLTNDDVWGVREDAEGSLVVRFKDASALEQLLKRYEGRRVASVLMGEVVAVSKVAGAPTTGELRLPPYPTAEGFALLLKEMKGR